MKGRVCIDNDAAKQHESFRPTGRSQASMPMTHSSGNLDLLRSLAVLFVLLSHLPFPPAIAPSSINLNALGYWGVFIFFVHTCYVLLGALDRQRSKISGVKLAVVFWLVRIARIYPLSIAVVIAVSMDAAVFGDGISQRVFWSNLLLIQNLTGEPSTPGPLWSLPFELQMYLVLPLIFYFAREKSVVSTLVVFALWALAVVATLYLMRHGVTHSWLKFAPFFLSGVLGYTLSKTKPFLSPHWVFGLVLLSAVSYLFLSDDYPSLPFLTWPLCLLLGALIAFSREIRSSRLRQVSKHVAKYSFGIYLLHVPCIDWAFHRWGIDSPALQWLVFLTLLISLSVSSYHWIERPLLQRAKQWTDKAL